MKKIAFILVCVLGTVTFSSCKSTAPCGLSSDNTKYIELDNAADVLVSELEIAE